MTRVRELDADDAPALTALYGEYAWWDDRQVEDVRAALESTEVALGVEVDGQGVEDDREGGEDGGDLVAAARVLTDHRYYATVFDVVVAADRRGEGLGREVMAAVVGHPDLQDLPGLSLLCRAGLVEFYESVGFEPYGGEVDVPEGGSEALVRMVYEHGE